ncbi:MAG: hypothetical protein LBI87_03005 [Candidatus Accumulibacter sp.]|jgi:hypothetical protein|nr:hypothetical protein [Accumulibacter sp.]
MCVLCGELVTHIHWTDQKAHDREYSNQVVVGQLQRERMRNRLERVRFVNMILAYYGLSLKDWNGSKYLLSDRKGKQSVIGDLGEMWVEAQKMSRLALDPLDSGLLEFLRQSGAPGKAVERNGQQAEIERLDPGLSG